MAKKTSLPAGFTSKTNYQTLSGIPAGQKVNATTEWNLGIQDLADSIDENYERLILNWTNDISVDQVLALGQYVDYNDVVYRVTTSYDVSDPKTFTSGNFQEINSIAELNTWYVNPSATGGNGTPQRPYTVNEAMSAASDGDVIYFQAGSYTTDISVSKNLYFVGYSKEACDITVTNFVFDTSSGIVNLSIDNIALIISNSMTQGTNNAYLILKNVIGSFSNDIIIERIRLYESEIGANNITTGSWTTVFNSYVITTTFTIDGTSTFDHARIIANISAAGRTLTFYTSFVGGNIVCANLTYNNTTITGTKTGTSSTTFNNQDMTLRELSADPSDPSEGNSIMWQSDGTGSGDDGDIMMKITAAAVTKTATIVDFSAI